MDIDIDKHQRKNMDKYLGVGGAAYFDELVEKEKNPYFCVVMKKYFDKLADGTQRSEIRPNNYRGWDIKNIYPGRFINFSAGYGKKHRMLKVVINMIITYDLTQEDVSHDHIEAVEAIYGKRDWWLVARVNHPLEAQMENYKKAEAVLVAKKSDGTFFKVESDFATTTPYYVDNPIDATYVRPYNDAGINNEIHAATYYFENSPRMREWLKDCKMVKVEIRTEAIGIEIEEKYCEIAARRLSQEVLQFNA